MPYNRPGNILVDVVATKQVTHGTPCIEDNVPGVAVKTKEEAISAGITARNVIVIGEAFNMIVKGVVQVANAIGATRGAPLYIVAATNALTLTVGTNPKYGRVAEVAGQRGCPAGFMRVNLDLKDTF